MDASLRLLLHSRITEWNRYNASGVSIPLGPSPAACAFCVHLRVSARKEGTSHTLLNINNLEAESGRGLRVIALLHLTAGAHACAQSKASKRARQARIAMAHAHIRTDVK